MSLPQKSDTSDSNQILSETKISDTHKNENLNAVLSKAIVSGDVATVESCLAKGAKPSEDSIDEAENGTYPEVCKVLIIAGVMQADRDFGAAGDLLINAVWELKMDFARWLLEHGADPNSGHLMGDSTSAITAAAERGNVDMAKMLIEHGAQVSGTGALPGAAGKGSLPMIRFLTGQGADIEEVGVHDFGDRRKKTEEGTALHKSAARGDIEVATFLLEKGAKIDARDPLDRTPLQRAEGAHQEKMVEFLKARGG